MRACIYALRIVSVLVLRPRCGFAAEHADRGEDDAEGHGGRSTNEPGISLAPPETDRTPWCSHKDRERSKDVDGYKR